MAKGRKPSVSSFERQYWLDEMEKGKGVTRISREAKRDIRVVKRQISIAQTEREASKARHDFLLGRLEKHQHDLLAEAQRLRTAIEKFPPRSIDPEDKRLGELTNEGFIVHVKGPISKMLESYKHLVHDYKVARDNMEKQLSDIEARLIEDIAGKASLYPWSERLVQLLEQGDTLEHKYASAVTTDNNYMLSWGEFNLNRIAITLEEVKLVEKAHQKLLDEARKYSEIVQNHRQNWEDSARPLLKELDILQLKGFVEGHCLYCPI
jgi:hypothetical protein